MYTIVFFRMCSETIIGLDHKHIMGSAKMVIRFTILMFALAILACNTAYSTTITCTFNCTSNDNDSTMTHYSYLKEPRLEENGYTEGYKAGSLNHLVEGNIKFTDKIEYYDGQEVSPNSTLKHNQTVDFNGKKGISEFYAKGFFPNNRAISAFKKIRYDDINVSRYNDKPSDLLYSRKNPLYLGRSNRTNLTTPYSTNRYCEVPDPNETSSSIRDKPSQYRYKLGEKSYYSNTIVVNADVKIGPEIGRGFDYDFQYDATVTNGVIEIRDATGWTNRTGARRIDWEQDALMKGNISMENDLNAKGLFVPAAGINDEWLPCCFDGSHPPVENRDHSAVLKPDKLLPKKELNRTYNLERINDTRYTINSTNPRNFVTRRLDDFTCSAKNCSGYECIYTYAEAEGSRIPPGVVPPPANVISVDKDVVSVNGSSSVEVPVESRLIKRSLSQIPSGVPIPVKNGSTVQYRIEVSHDNVTTPLMNISVTDILHQSLEYEDGSATLYYETALGPVTRDIKYEWRVGNNVTWALEFPIVNTRITEEHAFISFNATVGAKLNETVVNTALAVGTFGPEGDVISSNKAEATLKVI